MKRFAVTYAVLFAALYAMHMFSVWKLFPFHDIDTWEPFQRVWTIYMYVIVLGAAAIAYTRIVHKK